MYQKHYENGIPLIPLRGKIPLIPAWQTFSLKMPTQEVVDEFEKSYKGCNFGVVLGPASELCAIDLDVDIPEIAELIPPSPFQRRGKKGFVRFYRADLKNPPVSRTHREVGIEILYTGRQAVIPPSIHPETNEPYGWMGPDDLLNLNLRAELPLFSRSDQEILFTKLHNGKYLVQPDLRNPSQEGRNNKLVDIITAMRCHGKPEDQIILEVYEYDKNRHNPRLFMDPAEPFRAKNEEEALYAAWKLVSSVTSSLIRNKAIPIEFFDEEKLLKEDEKQTHLENQPIDTVQYDLPKPSPGLLLDAMELIQKMSTRRNYSLSMGGAISLFATLFSNKFTFQGIWPNMYVLNLADTGAGKNAPQEFAKKVLFESNLTDYLGQGGYRSGAAFLKNLSAKQTRLDIIDEVSSIFSMMNSNLAFQADLMEFMCQVWSSSNSWFMAHEQKSEENTSTAYHPCINILGSTTQAGLTGSISKFFFSKGLIPRFVIFNEIHYHDFKGVEPCDTMPFSNKIREIGEIRYRYDDRAPRPDWGKKYQPYTVGFADPSMEKDWFEFMRICANEIAEPGLYDTEKQMMTRKVEQVAKLTLIHALCRQYPDGIVPPPRPGKYEYPIVTRDDLFWAIEVFDVCLKNMRPILVEHNSDSSWENDLSLVREFIYDNEKGVAFSSIIQFCAKMDLRKIMMILEQLKAGEEIIEKVIEGTRKKVFFPYQETTPLARTRKRKKTKAEREEASRKSRVYSSLYSLQPQTSTDADASKKSE